MKKTNINIKSKIINTVEKTIWFFFLRPWAYVVVLIPYVLLAMLFKYVLHAPIIASVTLILFGLLCSGIMIILLIFTLWYFAVMKDSIQYMVSEDEFYALKTSTGTIGNSVFVALCVIWFSLDAILNSYTIMHMISMGLMIIWLTVLQIAANIHYKNQQTLLLKVL